MKWNTLMTAFALFGLIGNGGYLIYSSLNGDENGATIDVPKSFCIEFCVRVSQDSSVFPDFHQNVQRCNYLFADVEYCQLTAKGKE